MRSTPPIHPGEVLLEEFMVPLDLSANGLARSLGVPANRISAIVNGTRSVTADTALRLAKAFDTTPNFWMNLQTQYELEATVMENSADIEKTVKEIGGVG